MKSLIINTVYKQGSTGRLAYYLCQYLKNFGDDVLIIYGTGKIYNDNCSIKIGNFIENKFHNLFGRITGLNGCFSNHSTNRIIKLIEKYQPDVVFLGNLHGHYIHIFKLYDYFKTSRIPIVQIMWDEYPMTGSCSFAFDCIKFKDICENCPEVHSYPISWFFDTSTKIQKLKKKSYSIDRIAFVSVPYTAERAKNSYLLHDKQIFFLDEAVDQTNIFFPRDSNILKQELGITENDIVILTVSYYPSMRKGGAYFLDLARKCISEKNTVFIHVGFMGNVNECPSNYIPIGFERDQERLAMYYSLADLFVCTSLAETQPITCLESLSCGTPICGFNISGIPSCADFPFGQYVQPGDVEALKKIVLACNRKTYRTIESTKNYAHSRFDIENYCARLRHIGCELLQESKD